MHFCIVLCDTPIVLNVRASVFPCVAGLLVLLSGIFLAHTKWPGFLGVRDWWGWHQPLNHLVENARRSCRRYVVRRVDWVCWVSEHCQGCWTCSHQQRALVHFTVSSQVSVSTCPSWGRDPRHIQVYSRRGVCVCDEMHISNDLCIIYICTCMYITFSADRTLCGWLWSKHQLSTVLCTSKGSNTYMTLHPTACAEISCLPYHRHLKK